jgi:hypothetical protein
MIKKILTLSIIVFFINACKEEDVINTAELTSTQACVDHLTADNIFNDVGRTVKEGLQNNGQNKSFPNYNLINAETSDIDTLIINFGNENFLHNGKLRRGAINITFTGKYREYYSVITSTFDNYYINNNLIQGKITLTNQGVNNNGNMLFTIDVDSASIGTSEGRIDWQSKIVRVWINGQNTNTITDDQYKVTGTASGNGLNGNNFTMTITDTLNIDLGCLPSCIIKSGNAKISPIGYTDRVIKYGDSLCDCNVDVIINGDEYLVVIEN